MKLRFLSMTMILPALATVTACQSTVPLEQYDQDMTEAEQRVRSLESEIENLNQEIADLSKDIDRLRDSVPEFAARDILGRWNRVIPSSTRTGFGGVSVVDVFYVDPAPGASEQLNKAFLRLALISARDLVASDIRYAESDEQYRILNQCLEYIMGVNSVTRACGLE